MFIGRELAMLACMALVQAEESETAHTALEMEL